MKKKSKATLTPRLRFPEFRDAGTWEPVELGLMTTKVGSGITPRGGDKNYRKTGRPFIRSQNVGWGELLLDDMAYIDEKTHQSFDGTELQLSDVLLNISGASIGRSAIANSKIAGGNVNQHVCILRTKPDELNPHLLNQYVLSENGQKQIASFQAGGNRQGLNFAQIRSFLVPLPPDMNEQQKIAECLGSLDKLIAAEDRKLTALRDHKRGLMQQLFPQPGQSQPRLRFPEFRGKGEWKEKRLDDIASLSSGGTPSKDEPRFWNGDIPWISASSMHEASVWDSELRVTQDAIGNGTRLAPKGSILILVRGSMLFRRVPICVAERDVAFNQDVKCIRTKSGVVTSYLLHHLIAFASRIEIHPTGIGAGKIDTRHLEFMIIGFPSDQEQHRIANCLSALDTQITAQTSKLDALRTHERGLMQQLFPDPKGN